MHQVDKTSLLHLQVFQHSGKTLLNLKFCHLAAAYNRGKLLLSVHMIVRKKNERINYYTTVHLNLHQMLWQML